MQVAANSLSHREREGAAERRKGEGVRSYDNHRSGTVQRARQLRRAASAPERWVLRALREAFPHLKWRHQAPVGPFYADILCFSERLIIEVDGDDHALKPERDAQRTRFLESEGYDVIRFANADVMMNLDGVVANVGARVADTKKGGTA
ncbi:endonuclease domain-containing protein [Sphingomonas sp. MA1305]|uniref:endonuclease domain-containing protein n=1 Tax=Sphingomonas sp. MA1305 TaxID=2479204 RepID=UPI002FCD5582